jgi:hypothetical protein
MRTPSTQDAILLPTNTYATHARLWVEQPGAADAGIGSGWVCLSDYPGLGDLTISITRGETVDDPCASLQVTMCRDFGLYSLSPEALRSPLNLVGGSFVPLIKGGRGIRLYVAISPAGAAPNTDAWHLKFDGHIDTLDLANGDSTIGLQARDLGGRLQATQIEASRVYGSDAGVPIEDVIQGILDDNNTGVTLVAPASPGWDLHKYQQDKTNVMDAIRALAVTQLGWELRYKWNTGASRFDLTLWDIDRAKTAVDDTITPAQVRSWKSASEDATTIRNVVKIVYKVDTATGERSSYTASDATSIADNGRMACEIVEDASSQIDDETSATRMANAILSDLKDALIAGSNDTVPRPHVELGDLLTFTADNTPLPRWSDIDQTLAVVGVQDDFTAEASSTALSLRGKPSGGFERWLQLEARKGVGSNRALVAVDGATGSAATATLGGITVVYDQPTAVNWVYSEIHLSTVSGFTPSAATLQYRGKSTSYTIGGLIPGTTYYVKIVVVDSAGNRSTASSQTIIASALVGPGHVDHAGALDPPVPNGTFSVTSPPAVLGAVPPDNWSTWAHSLYTPYNFDLPGVWDHGVALDTTAGGTTSGNAAIRFTDPSFTQPSGCNAYGIRSSLIPVIEGEQYVTYIKANVDPATARPQVGVIWYDVNRAYLSHQLAATSGTADNTWQDFNFTSFSTAIGARFASVIILVAQPGLTGAQTFVVDDVQFGRYARVHPGDFVDVTTKQVVGGQKTFSKMVASKTLNALDTTDLLNVSIDSPETPVLSVDTDGLNTNVRNTLVTSGANGLLKVSRDNCNNMIQLEPPASVLDADANAKKWWFGSSYDYGDNAGKIGASGFGWIWNQTDARIEWGWNYSGQLYMRGMVGTGTRVVEAGADGWTTVGAAGKYEETSHKNIDGGYVGRDADGVVSIPGSTLRSTLRVGTAELQGFGLANSFLGDNFYFDGTKFLRRATGVASAIYHLWGEISARVAATGAAGSEITAGGLNAWVAKNDGTMRFPQHTSIAYVAFDADGKPVAAATPLTNPMTTLGDVPYGGADGVPTRLVGQTTDGSYLLGTTTASSTAAAPAWVSVSASGGNNTVPRMTATGSLAYNTNTNNPYPTLGVRSGAFSFARGASLWGLCAGTDESTGNSWIQAQRFDGTATAYDLVLQPSGGGVVLPGAAASQLLATSADKKVVNIPYSSAGGNGSYVPLADASGRFAVGGSDSAHPGRIQVGTAGYVSGNNWYWWTGFAYNLAADSTGDTDSWYTPMSHGSVGYGGMAVKQGGLIEWYSYAGATTAGATVTPTVRMSLVGGVLNLPGLTASRPVVTDANKNLISGAFGNSAGTFCEGNDWRLDNAMYAVDLVNSRPLATDADGFVVSLAAPTSTTRGSDYYSMGAGWSDYLSVTPAAGTWLCIMDAGGGSDVAATVGARMIKGASTAVGSAAYFGVAAGSSASFTRTGVAAFDGSTTLKIQAYASLPGNHVVLSDASTQLTMVQLF